MTACLMPAGDVGLIVDESTYGVGDEAKRIFNEQRNITLHYLTAPSTSGSFRSGVEAVIVAAQQASTDDWDGSGARRVSDLAAFHAIRLLRHVPGTVPVPDVFADPDGDVVLDWSRNTRWTFSVSVTPRGELHYAGLFGDGRLRGREPFFTDELPDTVRNGLLRVYRD